MFSAEESVAPAAKLTGAQGIALPDAQDIDSILRSGGWTFQHTLFAVVIGALFLCEGVANQVLGVSMPSIMADMGVRREAMSIVGAGNALGTMLGAIFGGAYSDRFGRRIGLLGALAVAGAATAACALARDPLTLAAIRMVDGLGIGAMLAIGTAYVGELWPPRWRAAAIAWGGACIPLGAALVSLAAARLLAAQGWRGVFVGCSILLLAILVSAFLVLPESPRFLAARPQRREDLQKLLRRIGVRIAPDTTITAYARPEGQTRASALLGHDVRRNTLALWTIFLFCLMSNTILMTWLPTMMAAAGRSVAQASRIMMIFGLGATAGGLITGVLIARLGARPTLLALTGTCVASSLLLGLLPGYAGVGPLALVLTLGAAISGIHIGMYTLAALSFPTLVRATGVGSCVSVGRIGALLGAFIGASLVTGGADAFFNTLAVALLGCLLSILCLKKPALLTKPRAGH